MIDQIDERLKAWVENVAGAVTIALTPPRDTQPDPVVHVYLLQLVPALATPDNRRLPRQVMLHYLVAVRAAEPQRAHQLLGDLIFAALDSSDFELDFNPVPLEMWIALGVEPQPAFMLKVPLSRERVTSDVPLVREPLVTRVTSITSLQGVVLGAEDVPLYGALVEIPGLRQSQRTDSHGRFRFPTVPADPPIKRVRVSAKGRATDIDINHALASEPVVIRLFSDDPS